MGVRQLITFEDTVTKYGRAHLENGYAGLNWANVGTQNTAPESLHDSGYLAAAHGHAVAFNEYTKVARFWSDENSFSLKSGHFAAAWNVGLTVVFDAYRDGVKVAHYKVTLDQVDTKIVFDERFAHIDKIAIHGFGGTDGVGDGQGEHIAIDNLLLVWDAPAQGPLGHEGANIPGIHDIGPEAAGLGMGALASDERQSFAAEEAAAPHDHNIKHAQELLDLHASISRPPHDYFPVCLT